MSFSPSVTSARPREACRNRILGHGSTQIHTDYISVSICEICVPNTLTIHTNITGYDPSSDHPNTWRLSLSQEVRAGKLSVFVSSTSGNRSEEALEVGAFGEAHGVVDGVAGAVDLGQGPARLRRRPVDRREEGRRRSPGWNRRPSPASRRAPVTPSASPVEPAVGLDGAAHLAPRAWRRRADRRSPGRTLLAAPRRSARASKASRSQHGVPRRRPPPAGAG